MGDLKQAFDTIGLGPEFTAAVTVYLLFYGLDRAISAAANRRFSQIIKGERLRAVDLQATLVEAFDRLYAYPLLSAKAVLRSVAISTVVFLLWQFFHMDFAVTNAKGMLTLLAMYPQLIPAYLFPWAAAVLSDYFSLFAVRRLLLSAQGRILRPLVVAAAAGWGIIYVMMSLGRMAELWMYMRLNGPSFVDLAATLSLAYRFDTQLLIWIEPALLVHVWLPLLAFGLIGMRVWQALLTAIGKTQWLLKGGTAHPLRAAGMVAALLAFAGSGIIHLARWWSA